MWARSDHAAPSDAAGSSAVAPQTSATDALPVTTQVSTTSTALPTLPPTTTSAPNAPTGCGPTPGFATDIDGDGCPEIVAIDGPRVTIGATTWVVGLPGDALTVGDWDCDGTATVALLRPTTGEVFVFDRWVGSGEEETVRPSVTVEGGAALTAKDADGDGCSTLSVSAPGGLDVDVPLESAP
jgi:hypothetical protein